MAITPVDKIKIMKFLRDNPIDDIYYLDLCDALGKRGKIRDTEFLEFFVDTTIKEFKKNDKISIKLISKLVSVVEAFLGWIHDDESQLDDMVLDKIRSFEEYYDEYLNRTNNDRDLEFTNGYLASVLKTVNKLYPQEVKSESVIQYLNEIEDLKSKLASLKREFENISLLYENLKVKYDKRQEDFTKKSDECAKASQVTLNQEKRIKQLNQIIASLNEKIKELEESLVKVNTENIELSEYRKAYEKALTDLESVRGQLEEHDKEKSRIILQEINDSNIEALIYKKLLVEGANINQIIEYLGNNGYTLSKDYVYNLLNRIKSKINLVNGTFSLSPTYKIVMPKILENGVFDIGVVPGTKRYDIMLVADFHLKEINKKVISGMNGIYEYCSSHDINLILNLGDFYDHLTIGDNFENASSNYKLVEETISLLPKSDGIYQAILGGNHDKKLLKYGFDPIDMLAHEREDIINLGYSHATVTLNGSKSVLNSFDLHHPQGMYFALSLGDDGVDSDNILSLLEDFYESTGRSRDDSFVDIFGHTHKSQFNFKDSYCFIPSFIDSRAKKGACHLRIYLDEDTQIKYMVFMPLSFTDNFTKQTEIIYQKVLSM